MKIACIYFCVNTNEQDIARQADIKVKLKIDLIYPKYIRTVNSTRIAVGNTPINKHVPHTFLAFKSIQKNKFLLYKTDGIQQNPSCIFKIDFVGCL